MDEAQISLFHSLVKLQSKRGEERERWEIKREEVLAETTQTPTSQVKTVR
jgi:hypothetical protein